MRKSKTKFNQADIGMFTDISTNSGILKHNQAYSGIIQVYSGIFRTLCIFNTLEDSEPDAYSESCQTSTLVCFVKIVYRYNYFHNISFSRSLLYELNIMNFLMQVSFSPQKYLFYIKKYEGSGDQAVEVCGLWILMYWSLYVYQVLYDFLKRFARQIEIKNWSAERLLAAMRIILLNVPLAKLK